MPDKWMKKPKSGFLRPKPQTALFFLLLMLSSALMYLDMALRFGN